jgi:hypothetical protein
MNTFPTKAIGPSHGRTSLTIKGLIGPSVSATGVYKDLWR